jgi:hypothetical protein
MNYGSSGNSSRVTDSNKYPQASTSGQDVTNSRSNGVNNKMMREPMIEAIDDDEDLDDSRFEEVVTL